MRLLDSRTHQKASRACFFAFEVSKTSWNTGYEGAHTTTDLLESSAQGQIAIVKILVLG